jgi:hypothetical protein
MQTTWHDVVKSVSDFDEAHDERGLPLWHEDYEYQIIRCKGCETYSFRETSESPQLTPEEAVVRLWPPRDTKKTRANMGRWTSLPVKLRSVYLETNRAITSAQPLLAAVGIRAIVEAVCTHKRANGHNLLKRIDDLVTKGILTKREAAVLHKTRFLGNKAAHEAKPASPEALENAMKIAEHMLTSVYLLKGMGKVVQKG